jgi:glyoxylase-like metal-dependent hydrolase (beta-lactamase superfamily II)
MNDEIYRFNLGTFKCTAISDGTFTYAPPMFPPPAIFLFANASRDPLEHVLGKHNIKPEQWSEWVSPYICLLINTGSHRVLVDTGADGLGSNTGRLLQNLKAEGIDPEDINTVILTHGHPDHIGGNTDSEGKPSFPNAQYVMWKDEWDFWNSEETALKLEEHSREILLGYARKNLPPIQDQLSLFDHEAEILPGIKAIAAPGHTPGHMALAISSESEQLLCIADAVLHPIQLERPDWHAVVDFHPEQLEATRHKILARAATDNALVLAFHFPFPGLGRVIAREIGWQWQPINMTN